MGFGARRTFKKHKKNLGRVWQDTKKIGSKIIDPLGFFRPGGLEEKFRKKLGFAGSGEEGPGAQGPDFGFQDPSTIEAPPMDLDTPFIAPPTSRRSLQNIFSDQAFSTPGDEAFEFRTGPLGPSIEDDSAAFDQFLAAGEAGRRREEGRATEGVLDQLQGRGLARSGIALRDIVDKVIGPSAERGGQMAAQFGLEQARRRSDLLEAERGRQAALNMQRLGGRQQAIGQARGGRLQAILGGEDAASAMDRLAFGQAAGAREQALGGQREFALQKLRGAQGERALNLESQIANRQAMEERRRRRKGGLMGLLGGVAGGFVGGPGGAMIGSQLGNQLGDSF